MQAVLFELLTGLARELQQMHGDRPISQALLALGRDLREIAFRNLQLAQRAG